MLTTLPRITKNNRLPINLNIFFIVLLELLILSNVALGQKLNTSLPTHSIVCVGTAGISLTANAEHPVKELAVKRQNLQKKTLFKLF